MIEIIFFPLSTTIHPHHFSRPIIQTYLDQFYPTVRCDYVDDIPVLTNENFISITHKDKLMVLAISEQPIGIDLESKQTLSEHVIKRFNLDIHNPLLSWCIKEATFKLTQQSLTNKSRINHITDYQLYHSQFDLYCLVVASSIKSDMICKRFVNEAVEVIDCDFRAIDSHT